MRSIVILTIIDRAVQQSICLVLKSLVELTSDFNSFSFRRHRSAKIAIGILRELLKTLYKNYITKSFFRQIEGGVPFISHEDK